MAEELEALWNNLRITESKDIEHSIDKLVGSNVHENESLFFIGKIFCTRTVNMDATIATMRGLWKPKKEPDSTQRLRWMSAAIKALAVDVGLDGFGLGEYLRIQESLDVLRPLRCIMKLKFDGALIKKNFLKYKRIKNFVTINPPPANKPKTEGKPHNLFGRKDTSKFSRGRKLIKRKRDIEGKGLLKPSEFDLALVLERIQPRVFARINEEMGKPYSTNEQLNVDESEVVFRRNTPSNIKASILDILKIKEVDTHDKYLGLSTVVGRSEKDVSWSINDRVCNQIQGWKEKQLSNAGKK
ncbi:hypothetical protein ACH5RR_031848 [Cinchona calisaya]|uniref:Uncharacterized protein n=1 Tax=Cinchona calisaya TaxID=153742 RepID=A0ABD2YGF1_9GENT